MFARDFRSALGIFSVMTGFVLSTSGNALAVVTSSPVAHDQAIVADRLNGSEYWDLQQAGHALNAKAADRELAINALNLAVEKNPTQILACYSLALTYLERAKASEAAGLAISSPEIQGDLQRAEAALERVQSLNPDAVSVSFKLGKIALLRNHPEDALEYYRNGLEADDHNPALHFNIAGIYEQLGHTPMAIFHYEQAIKYKPGFTYALNNLGLLYEKLKRPLHAERCYKQALKADPNYAFARLNLGTLYAEQQKNALASKAFQQVLSHHPDNAWAYFYLGNIAFRQSNYSQAAKNYQASIDCNSKYATAHYLLAVSLIHLNRMEEAARVGMAYLSLDPNGPFVVEITQMLNTLDSSLKTQQANGESPLLLPFQSGVGRSH